MTKTTAPPGARGKAAAWLLFGILLLVVIVIAAADEKQVMAILWKAHDGPLTLAVLATLGSLGAVTLSYVNLFAAVRHRVGFRRMFGVNLVSNAFNVVVSSGGVSGGAVRAFLMKRLGVPIPVTVAVSFVQAMLSNVVMALLCVGLVAPLWKPALETGFPVGRVVSAGIVALLALAAAQAGGLFLPRLRESAFAGVEALLGRWARGGPAGRAVAALRRTNEKFDRCAKLLGGRWDALGWSFLCLTLDWSFYLAALWACFNAVKVSLEPVQLLTVFAAVFLTTEISVTPSGLGVSEGLVAWVLQRRGIPLEQALAAMLLFRAVYFFLPVMLALVSHLELIWNTRRGKN